MKLKQSILPHLWTEYLREMWNRSVPTDYPESTSEFSIDFGDDKSAVAEMESNLDTEESVITEHVEDNEFVTRYVGTFEVTGEPGEHVLVSPERVDDGPMYRAEALHYNAESGEWEKLENTVIEDGYVYADVNEFSPIAVFVIRRDIEDATGTVFEGKTVIACNGNPVVIYTDEEDSKVYVKNAATGKKIEFPASKAIVVGGSVDGTPVDKVSIYGSNFKRGACSIYSGSCNPDEEVIAEVGSVNLKLSDSTIGGITCSAGAVRTEEYNLTLDNVRTALIGSGESLAHGVCEVDANTLESCQTSKAAYCMKKVVYNLINSRINDVYVGGTCGYSRTEDTTLNMKGCTIYGYTLLCPSNGYFGSCKATIEDTTAHMLQSTNRGIVDKVDATLNNCTFDYVFVAGDNTDSTVKGIVNQVALDIGKGTYKLLAPGTNGGVELTDNAIVKYVKYSRSADITFSENAKPVLGDKLIMK